MSYWVIALWNWNPMATIVLYLAIGCTFTGFVFKFDKQLAKLLPGKTKLDGPGPGGLALLLNVAFWLIIIPVLLIAIILCQLFRMRSKGGNMPNKKKALILPVVLLLLGSWLVYIAIPKSINAFVGIRYIHNPLKAIPWIFGFASTWAIIIAIFIGAVLAWKSRGNQT